MSSSFRFEREGSNRPTDRPTHSWSSSSIFDFILLLDCIAFYLMRLSCDGRRRRRRHACYVLQYRREGWMDGEERARVGWG